MAFPFDDWQPVIQTATDRVTAHAAGSLHDLLDREGPRPVAGDPLPLLWHWLAFLPQARQTLLGSDGHPPTGGFLPPVGPRRRMYAGGRVAVGSTPTVEQLLTRTSTVSDITTKSGRSGELVFVGVDHALTGGGADIHEHQDLVYRQVAAAGERAAPAPAAVPATGSDDWEWERTVTVDPTVLFRFSALTYNAHRIHYDRQYATEVEGYPGLVVHGPLQAILLADALTRHRPDTTPVGFQFRALSPAFDDADLQLRGRDAAGGTVELAAFSGDRQTMRATATCSEATDPRTSQ